MRGRILQDNGSEGSGIVVVDGQQHKFTIATRKGDTALVVGKTVDVVVAESAVQTGWAG
jgi:Neuraminidase (sialidase)